MFITFSVVFKDLKDTLSPHSTVFSSHAVVGVGFELPPISPLSSSSYVTFEVSSGVILSSSWRPLVSGSKKVNTMINRLCPTLSHMKTEGSTLTMRAERTVARRPKVLASPKARPRICVG